MYQNYLFYLYYLSSQAISSIVSSSSISWWVSVEFFKRRNNIKMPTRYYSITTLTVEATSLVSQLLIRSYMPKRASTRQSIKNIHRYPPILAIYKCPIEILDEIFSMRCTDRGATGRLLSTVSLNCRTAQCINAWSNPSKIFLKVHFSQDRTLSLLSVGREKFKKFTIQEPSDWMAEHGDIHMVAKQ